MNLPFRKKSAEPATTLPPEVQQYYQAERRERTWVAWLLAIGTLLVTIAIILALFFAGRWVYRKVKHTNKPSTTTTQTQSGNTSKTSNASNQSSDGKTSNGNSNSGTSSNTPSSGSTSAPTGNTGSTGVVPPTAARTSIPNTGPGDTVALFFSVSVLGYLLHRFILAKD